MKKTFEVDQDFIIEAYGVACKEWKDKLKNKFPEAWPQSIMDKIKTFEDVEKHIGKVLLPYANPITKEQISTNAFVKIQYISKALNQGWVPDFGDCPQQKWYPFFKKEKAGWVFGLAGYDYAHGLLSSDFYFKSEELAKYAGTQFLEIYKEYLPL